MPRVNTRADPNRMLSRLTHPPRANWASFQREMAAKISAAISARTSIAAPAASVFHVKHTMNVNSVFTDVSRSNSEAASL